MKDLFGIPDKKRSRSDSVSSDTSVSSVATATSDMNSPTIKKLQQQQVDYDTANTHYMKTNLTDLNSPITYDNNQVVPHNSLFNFIRVSDYDRRNTYKNKPTYKLVRDENNDPSHFVPFSKRNSEIQQILTSGALDLHNAGVNSPPSGTTDSDPDTLIGGKRRKSKKTKTSKKSKKARKTKGAPDVPVKKGGGYPFLSNALENYMKRYNRKSKKKSKKKSKRNKSSRHSKHK